MPTIVVGIERVRRETGRRRSSPPRAGRIRPLLQRIANAHVARWQFPRPTRGRAAAWRGTCAGSPDCGRQEGIGTCPQNQEGPDTRHSLPRRAASLVHTGGVTRVSAARPPLLANAQPTPAVCAHVVEPRHISSEQAWVCPKSPCGTTRKARACAITGHSLGRMGFSVGTTVGSPTGFRTHTSIPPTTASPTSTHAKTTSVRRRTRRSKRLSCVRLLQRK